MHCLTKEANNPEPLSPLLKDHLVGLIAMRVVTVRSHFLAFVVQVLTAYFFPECFKLMVGSLPHLSEDSVLATALLASKE